MAEETAKPAPSQPNAAPAKPAVKEVKAGEEKADGRRKNHPDNCVKCNKRLSKKQWYYRNGQFYCSKTCWKATDVKKAA